MTLSQAIKLQFKNDYIEYFLTRIYFDTTLDVLLKKLAYSYFEWKLSRYMVHIIKFLSFDLNVNRLSWTFYEKCEAVIINNNRRF